MGDMNTLQIIQSVTCIIYYIVVGGIAVYGVVQYERWKIPERYKKLEIIHKKYSECFILIKDYANFICEIESEVLIDKNGKTKFDILDQECEFLNAEMPGMFKMVNLYFNKKEILFERLEELRVTLEKLSGVSLEIKLFMNQIKEEPPESLDIKMTKFQTEYSEKILEILKEFGGALTNITSAETKEILWFFKIISKKENKKIFLEQWNRQVIHIHNLKAYKIKILSFQPKNKKFWFLQKNMLT